MDSGLGLGQEGCSRMDGAKLQFSGTKGSYQRRVAIVKLLMAGSFSATQSTTAGFQSKAASSSGE
jgi:hypothetical protein